MRSIVLVILLQTLTLTTFATPDSAQILEQDTLGQVELSMNGVIFEKEQVEKLLTPFTIGDKDLACKLSRSNKTNKESAIKVTTLKPVRIEKHVDNMMTLVLSESGKHESGRNIMLYCLYQSAGGAMQPLSVQDVNGYFSAQKMVRNMTIINRNYEMRNIPTTPSPLTAKDDTGQASATGHSTATILDRITGKNLDYSTTIPAPGSKVFFKAREANKQ